MNERPVRVRIAPSPTGDPHVGTAYVGLFNYVFARHCGGKFLLRVEDTDRERFKETSARNILDALAWLNISPDEGPEIGGPVGPYVQSERLAIYKQHAEELVETGHAYHCFCTKERLSEMRAKQEAEKADTRYDRFCLSQLTPEERRKKALEGEPHVIRMKMPDSGSTAWTDLVRGEVSFENALLDDQVLLKADGYPTYHLANVVDDHLMGITHVIRAEEWVSSTPKHIALYEMFGWEIPQFAHLPLLRNPDRSKISKRQSHTSLSWYRDEGFLPEALLNFLALLGWSHPQEKEIFSLQEMVEKFGFERFNKSGPVFDLEKLHWMNGLYIRELSDEDLYTRAAPFLQKAGILPADAGPEEAAYAKRCLVLEQEKARTLADFPGLVSFMIDPDFDYEEEALKKWLRPAPEHVRSAFHKQIEKIDPLPESELSAEKYEEITRAIAEELGVGAGKVIHPTRVAMSGRLKGPSLFHLMELLGKTAVLHRFNRAISIARGK
ncbi:MAG: glutamate--tRNA ligase [Armatimonadetes bacterium]|nr:glutamate--tRNA ligase [Armatimonadota bacterium]NIM23511.1 glutamate--tRNA ligase [Armatimonadota bacterium]NIM67377.1 glutamate--tRNA ligase [Armatimonadota bacterium]NIM75878.1 glutamate--tRNA ligase [Armatimonadota bacterium]NIN05563.1 glutamate--tRNA ligase [Armatimonadota bacterium]